MSAVPAARNGALALAGGYVADLVFGDPARLHPVAGFGWLADRVERLIYAPTRVRGALHTGLLVCTAAAAAELAARLLTRVLPGRSAGLGRPGVLALVTWGALGGRS